MVLSGISAGFFLFVLSKITEDMSKSELLSPIAAAWIPVTIGGLTGFVARRGKCKTLSTSWADKGAGATTMPRITASSAARAVACTRAPLAKIGR
jgi:hypothetical protein